MGDIAASSDGGSPASTESTSDPNYPAPSDVLQTAVDTGSAQNRFVGGKDRGNPDVGGLVITDANGNLKYRPGYLYWGTSVDGYDSHAESLAVDDAATWLQKNAEPGENYAVHVISEYQPCSSCSTNIRQGAWGDVLQNAANSRDANAGLFVWWHRNMGMVQFYWW